MLTPKLASGTYTPILVNHFILSDRYCINYVYTMPLLYSDGVYLDLHRFTLSVTVNLDLLQDLVPQSIKEY